MASETPGTPLQVNDNEDPKQLLPPSVTLVAVK